MISPTNHHCHDSIFRIVGSRSRPLGFESWNRIPIIYLQYLHLWIHPSNTLNRRINHPPAFPKHRNLQPNLPNSFSNYPSYWTFLASFRISQMSTLNKFKREFQFQFLQHQHAWFIIQHAASGFKASYYRCNQEALKGGQWECLHVVRFPRWISRARRKTKMTVGYKSRLPSISVRVVFEMAISETLTHILRYFENCTLYLTLQQRLNIGAQKPPPLSPDVII